MKVDKEQKRLKAIKLKYVRSDTECDYCGEEFKREKMWRVNRYGVNRRIHTWHYCQNCMHSAKEVLNEIDTDACSFGIAYVDDFNFFEKKDYTRMNAARDIAFRNSIFHRTDAKDRSLEDIDLHRIDVR